MKAASYRSWGLAGSAIGFFAGVLLAVVMPDEWWNLAFMPWFVEWFVLPEFILTMSVCLFFNIDCMSDAANPATVQTIRVLALVVVLSIYGLALGLVGCWVRRRRRRP